MEGTYMKKEIEKMLEFYHVNAPRDSVNALKEIVQEVVLQVLSQTDFFAHAAFYGGTALRIFYGLDRYSEDLDFSLKNKNVDFSLGRYLPFLERGLNSYGFEMEAVQKVKMQPTNIQSAFLKGNTLIHLLQIAALSPPISGVPSNELIKIKIEIDSNPPIGAAYERKYRLLPQPYSVYLYDKPSLFAGKLHALLCRNWKSRDKGRDFYDYVWYLQNQIPVNITHLEARMRQSGHWQGSQLLSYETLLSLLNERFAAVDYRGIKEDVIPFLHTTNSLELWDEAFFTSITREFLRIA
jgi:hypothetical protein